MLGTIAEAEDIVQDAWLRFHDARSIERPEAWLTTVVSRLAIDRLRSARRESYVGTWLPEPLVAEDDDPAAIVELGDSLTLGFLTTLDRLDPVDRAVFLLRDVFDLSYTDVAAAIGKTEANCRQIASRARARVRTDRPPRHVDPTRREALLEAFLAAVVAGDPEDLAPLLTEDAVQLSDGGPYVRAARRPVVGRQRVARFMANIAKRVPQEAIDTRRVVLNGLPGWVVDLFGQPYLLLEVEFDGDLVHRIHGVSNPAKVAAALGLPARARVGDTDTNRLAPPPTL